MTTADVRLVPARQLITAPVDALFALAPGDRALVAAGDSVVVGAPIAERLRDPRLDEVDLPEAAATPRPAQDIDQGERDDGGRGDRPRATGGHDEVGRRPVVPFGGPFGQPAEGRPSGGHPKRGAVAGRVGPWRDP